jgi:lipid-A-disaccharide synthase-like uncharacterized protein
MKRPALIFLELALLFAMGYWVYASLTETQPIDRPGGVEVTVQLPDARDKAILYKNDAGEYRYVITQEHDGQKLDLSANDVAERVMRGRSERSWGQTVLNVSSPIGYVWVGLGLLGQVLFTGRMIVQWLVSEKSKRSVVPPIFWWMSLGGSTMLMVYFLWRRDPIGLLGQSFGWFIYVRNLWMIYRPQLPHTDAIMNAEATEAATESPSTTDTVAANTPVR